MELTSEELKLLELIRQIGWGELDKITIKNGKPVFARKRLPPPLEGFQETKLD